MRSIAYAVAILAAAGIMYYVAMSPDAPAPDAPVAQEDIADVTTASLTMNVPEMHCPFACYPSIKKNLEERADVVSVELAPQKEEGVIDNPQVIVTYKSGFEPESAIAQLDKAGFSGSTVVSE